MRMSAELFKKIAAESFAHTKEVCLSCGYEAFVAENILEILEHLKGAPGATILTNGTLLNRTNIAKLIEVGLKRIFISFDGATRETFEKIRKGASFEKIVSNIALFNSLKKELGSADPEVCLTTVLMRSNIEEFPEIVRLAGQFGIHSMVCKSLVTPWPEMESERLENHRSLAAAYLEKGLVLAKKSKINIQLVSDLTKCIELKEQVPSVQKDAVSKKGKDRCADSLFLLSISPDGKVNPCSRWQQEPLGDFRFQSFQEIWNGEPFRKLREDMEAGIFNGGCLGCGCLD